MRRPEAGGLCFGNLATAVVAFVADAVCVPRRRFWARSAIPSCSSPLTSLEPARGRVLLELLLDGMAWYFQLLSLLQKQWVRCGSMMPSSLGEGARFRAQLYAYLFRVIRKQGMYLVHRCTMYIVHVCT